MGFEFLTPEERDAKQGGIKHESKKTSSPKEIIWDLSSQIGELKNENMMLKLQIKEIKNILNFG